MAGPFDSLEIFLHLLLECVSHAAIAANPRQSHEVAGIS
jgi:hypothetical protein